MSTEGKGDGVSRCDDCLLEVRQERNQLVWDRDAPAASPSSDWQVWRGIAYCTVEEAVEPMPRQDSMGYRLAPAKPKRRTKTVVEWKTRILRRSPATLLHVALLVATVVGIVQILPMFMVHAPLFGLIGVFGIVTAKPKFISVEASPDRWVLTMAEKRFELDRASTQIEIRDRTVRLCESATTGFDIVMPSRADATFVGNLLTA